MMARAIAAIGVRVIALWLLVQGLMGAVLVLSVAYRGIPVAPSSRSSATVLSAERARDPAQTKAALWTTFPPTAVRLACGLLLLVFSKPVGALLAARVE